MSEILDDRRHYVKITRSAVRDKGPRGYSVSGQSSRVSGKQTNCVSDHCTGDGPTMERL